MKWYLTFQVLFLKELQSKPNNQIQLAENVSKLQKKNNKSIVAFVPGDGNIEFIYENDRVLIPGLGSFLQTVGDLPGVRFKVVHVADIGLNSLFRKKKEKRKAKIKIK